MLSTEHAEWAGKVRAAETALRGIRRNKGRTMATTAAVRRHEGIAEHFTSALLAAGHRELAGLLQVEASLAERVAGQPRTARPELRSRLAAARAELRKILAEAKNR